MNNFTFEDFTETKGLSGNQLLDWIDKHIAWKHTKHEKEREREHKRSLESERAAWEQAAPRRAALAKFGTAKNRFVDSTKLVERELIADALREKGGEYRQSFETTGNEYFEKKWNYLNRQAERYRFCGYEYVKLTCTCCEKTFLGASRCETRLCEHCSRKHAARVRRRQIDLVKQLPLDRRHRLAFLTLTKKVRSDRPPHGSDVKEAGRQVRKLVNRLFPKQNGCGAFSVLEIGDSDNIHIHLMVYGPFIWGEEISALWKAITKDSYIINIRSVKSPIQCINYLLKYINKPPKYKSIDQYVNLVDCLAGVRRIHTYGVFYGIAILRRDSWPCALCGGKVRWGGNDAGADLPIDAILLSDLYASNKFNLALR